MIAASVQTKVYLARQATDMRKGFPGLIALTETVLRQEPASGHWFVFINRRRDLIKILYWDGSGFCIWYKRLERGRFQLPAVAAGENSPGLEVTTVQLSLILQGIDLKSARQRLRYHRGSRERLPAPGAAS